MNKTPEEAFEPFKNVEFRPFRDSASGQCSYKCTVVLRLFRFWIV